MHPLWRPVPPPLASSTRAPFRPGCAARKAAVSPPVPAPRTTRSKSLEEPTAIARMIGRRTGSRCYSRPAVDASLPVRIVLIGIAYLVGSIPFGVIVAGISGGPDPRSIGSGRTGGTNALRALGRKWALVVVAGDLLKGALPVLLARFVTGGDATTEVLCAAAAVLGAWRSAFLGFTRGGRGVGTGVGTMLVIQPLAVVLAAPVFFGVILLTRYVSLG